MFTPKKPDPASKDFWFRSSAWNEAARADFEAHLARAKPRNRVQYRRIKALALLGTGDRTRETAGYEMLAGIVHDRDAPHDEKVFALSRMGAHDQERGRLDEAEHNLRLALDAMSTNRSGSTELEEIRLAEVLFERGGRERLEEARALLEIRVEKPPLLVSDRFRLCLAVVRVLLAMNEKSHAAEWASAALALAAATDSGFTYHRTLGLVETDAKTRAWLASVARQRA